MRAVHHRPCLMTPHSRLVASAASPRHLRFGAAVVFTLFLLPPSVGAQTRDPQQAALDDFVAARMLGTKCLTWQIDLAEARTRFAQLNLQPADWQDGGRHASFFDERLAYYGSLQSQMPEARACRAAEEAFGPVGRVRKNWMKRQ
jgi:hypothetical protein